MIKKTFRTLGSNPVILLGFALPFIISFLAFIPMLATADDIMNVIPELAAYSMETGQNPPIEMLSSISAGYFGSLGLSMLTGLITSLLILPPIFQKVYEACEDKKIPGWYGRGIKRSWWKVLVSAIIISAASTGIVLVVSILLIIPLIGFLSWLAAICAIAVFAIIMLTAVIAEDDFGTGLGNTFSIGKKYFLKQLGVIILALIPGTVFTGVIGGIMYTSFAKYTVSATPAEMINELLGDVMPYMWVLMAVFYIYYIFAAAFIYTYSMHRYLDRKSQTVTLPKSYNDAFDQYQSKYDSMQNEQNADKNTTKGGNKTFSGNLEDH